MRRLLPVIISVIAWPCLTANAIARDLTFDDRVKAQEVIERVDYSHQVGTTRRFEDAVPSQLLESKVSTYLKQTAALEEVWHTALTPEALEHELRRIIRSSRAPGRLEEIFQALGHDRFLIQECFVRPVLVNRLARSFLRADERFQGAAKNRVEKLRKLLLRNPRATPDRGIEMRVVDVIVEGEQDRVGKGPEHAAEWDIESGVLKHRVSRAEFERLRSRAPKKATEVGRVTEGPESFDLQVLLEASEESFRVAAYTVRKVSWDEWWIDARRGFNDRAVKAIARPAGSPLVQVSAAPESDSTVCVADDTWAGDGLDDPPVESSGAQTVWTGNEMLTWGTNVPARYDPLTDTWGRLSMKDAPVVVGYALSVWTGQEMIVWGGWPSTAGGRYDPVSDSWSPVSMVGAPAARVYFNTVWSGREMIVWGGSDGASLLNSGGRYDPATDTWSATSSFGAPGARESATAVWSGQEMIVWGGYDFSGPEGGANGLVSGGRYDPATDTWRTASAIGAPSSRFLHTSVWSGSFMIVWGGYDGTGPLATGARYDPETDTWLPVSGSNAPSGRYEHIAVWSGSEMLVWGGVGTGYLNTGARYEPGADRWVTMATTSAPTPRRAHAAVWTGRLLLVWGGADSAGAVDTGGRYDPDTDSWTPTATSNRPAGRSGHSAVWTGSRMIIWGGFRDLASLSSGASFDPLTSTWTEIATLDAPSPRVGHVAVWSGSLMVVWGGETGDNHRGTGGRYDPLADAWSPTNAVDSPFWNIYRAGASAVWTGTDMIVWGGQDTGERTYGGGGRYDPAQDTWAPVSLTGAPPARAYHTAVWTGSSMLVWGGHSRPFGVGPGTWYGDGYAYVPASDSWTRLSGLGAPSPRENHTAVWTGRRMLIWGGDGPDALLGDGAAYDAEHDSWETIPLDGAPPPAAGAGLFERSAAAVWADPVMILWGHDNLGAGIGGRYDTSTGTWKPVTSNGSPPTRTGFTAVWTGAEVIVWGGGGLSTGGAYLIDRSPDADLDGVTVCGGDCDDTDPLVHPGAAELCNHHDDNCDAQVDEGFGVGAACATVVDSCHQKIGALVCDAGGTGTQCDGVVTLHDLAAPTLTAAASPTVLWPPNHRMVEVGVSVAASDDCSQPVVSLLSVTSSEPADASGDADGETGIDVDHAEVNSADFNVALRAERDGSGAGRVYQVTYSAVDGAGHQAVASASVFVPHDLGGVSEPLLLLVEDGPAGTRVTWDAVQGAFSYQVVRGSVGSLRLAGDIIDLGTVTCILPDSDATSTQGHEDAGNPPLGAAFFYVASYNNGSDSGFGTETAPKPRVVTGGGCGVAVGLNLAPVQLGRKTREPHRH